MSGIFLKGLVALGVLWGCRLDRVPPVVVEGGSHFSQGHFGFPMTMEGPLEVGSGALAMAIPPNTSLTGFGGLGRRPWLPLISGLSKGASLCLPAQGVDTLAHPQVKAFLLKKDSTYFLLLSVDTVAVTADMTSHMLELLNAQKPMWGLTHTSFQMVATHTHSGPAGISRHPLWGPLGCDAFSEPMAKSFYGSALQAVSQAEARLAPVDTQEISYGPLEGLNGSRIKTLSFDKNYFRMRFLSGEKRVGCLQVFSIHPTFFGVSNALHSADLVGYIERAGVESEVPCLFLNGTVGNAEPRVRGEPKVYGQAVWEKGNELMKQGSTTPRFSFASIPLSLPKPTLNAKACGLPGIVSRSTHLGILDALPRVTKISTLEVDKFVLAFIPGEPTYDLWEFLQGLNPEKKLLFVSLANDYLGYLSTKNLYGQRVLESCSNLYGPDVQWVFAKGYQSLLDN